MSLAALVAVVVLVNRFYKSLSSWSHGLFFNFSNQTYQFLAFCNGTDGLFFRSTRGGAAMSGPNPLCQDKGTEVGGAFRRLIT